MTCIAAIALAVAASSLATVATAATEPAPLAAIDEPWSQERVQAVVPGQAALNALAKLGAKSYEERETGQREIESQDIPQVEIYALLWKKDLSAEQRIRLLNAAERRVLLAPRPMIGIQMPPDVPGQTGVLVVEVDQNAPAAQVLKAGDRIVEVAGSQVTVREDVIAAVQERNPGDTLRIAVVRTDGQQDSRLEFDVRLAAVPERSALAEATGLPPHMDAARHLRAIQLRETFAPRPVAVNATRIP